MGKYIDDTLARQAWEVAAAMAARPGVPAVPFVWDGGQWVTLGGQWRDVPMIRRGLGEWLLAAAKSVDAGLSEESRRRGLRAHLLEAQISAREATDPDEQAYFRAAAEGLSAELELISEPLGIPDNPALVKRMSEVASELLSASTGRANQLLAIASQFDAFRAAMKDPADWVAGLSAVPRSEHVRTSAVWDAFSLAEPVLARSLGVRTGKSLLFAAMDKRFGARRKLSGYEGWRGVTLAL
ncbi:hypothetical protein [Kitasatospora paranensis]|uniref:Uncharacterized protein n=1 Tax=Kitasatospora paranensis TaxID=258053 RepID=A0ABW2FZ50_9ACTN